MYKKENSNYSSSKYRTNKRHTVVDSQFTEPKEEKVFEITRLPELPEMWIDPHTPVFNQKKHDQTCTKNRKKRKKRKRR